ncbi:hypothetical protein [Reyranella sp.]|uniref:hypothetical protein n=1 Tax=Reyranella sp. TaxID=1929291 RepID=UPI002F943C45
MARAPFDSTLLLLACLAPCACAGPVQWSKPGSDSAVSARDTSDCRAEAQRQAARLYPGFASPYAAGAAVMMSQQHLDTDRAVAESHFFGSCMEARGYVRTR